MARNIFDQFDRRDEEQRRSGNVFDQFDPKQGGVSDIESFFSGLGDAASFGFGDEALGYLGGAWGALQGKDFEKERQAITNWSRGQQMLAQQANPLTYGGGQLLGAIGTGLGLGAGVRGALGVAGLAGKAANFAKGVGPLGRIASASATGAGGGALYGAASADDDRRLEGASEGALWGGLLGGAGHAVLGELVPHVAGRIGSAMSPNAGTARVVGEMQERFRQSPQDLAKAMDDAAPGSMLMDTLKGGVQIVKGAASRPGYERDVMREALDERNVGLMNKAVKDFWRTFTGKQGNAIDAGMEISRLEDEARALTKPLYDRVEAVTIPKPSAGALKFVETQGQPGSVFKPAVDRAISAVTGKASGVSPSELRAIQGTGLFWRRLMEEVNTEFDTLKGAAKTNPLGVPRGSAWKEVTAQRKGLADTLRANDMLGKEFADAQDIFSNRMARSNAIAYGYKIAKNEGDINIGKALKKISAMPEDVRFDARRGMIAGIVDDLEKAPDLSGKADVLRRVIGTPSKRNALNALLGGKVKRDGTPYASSAFSRLAQRLEDQHKLFENSAKTGIDVNSMTADKIAALRSQEQLSGPTGGGIKDMIWKMLTGHAADQYNETVSNNLLRLMRMPTAAVRNEINAAGGMKNWMKQQTLLAKAQRHLQQLSGFREQALLGSVPKTPLEYLMPNLGAPLGGLYANAAFGSPFGQLYGEDAWTSS